MSLEWRAPVNARGENGTGDGGGPSDGPSDGEVEITSYVVVVERLDETAADRRVVPVDAGNGSMVRTAVSGLRNGVAYVFMVHAVTADGMGPAVQVRATPTSGVDGEVAGLIVRFNPGTAVADGQEQVPGEAAVETVDMQIAGEIAAGIHVVELSEPVTERQAEAIAVELQADPRVAWAEPDAFAFTAAVRSEDAGSVLDDPGYAAGQWNMWGEYGVGVGDGPGTLTDAWSQGQGSGAVVAVIDTGMAAHPDLDARVVGGFDFVSNPAGLAAPRTPDGPDTPFDTDGQPGWDANPADPGDWRGVAPVRDSTWHGTHVAGVIAAEAGNGIGVVGVAPGTRVVPVRAIGWRGGLVSDIAAGIAWSAGVPVDGAESNANPADVVNMSFALPGTCPLALQAAIDAAAARGAVLVAAAGNASDNAGNYAPGNCDRVITVTATGRAGSRAPYSNFGPRVDIAAPGGDLNADGGVLSTSNAGQKGPGQPGYASREGTSIAAAHVSAAIARELAMGTSRAQVRARLGELARPFADDSCDPNPGRSCGPGILALTSADSPDPALAQVQAACSPTTTYSGGWRWTSMTATGSCTWVFPSVMGSATTDSLVIAGGGGGGTGTQSGGGGGAGGYRAGSFTATAGGTLTATVGVGGAIGASGTNSSASGAGAGTVTAIGGGRGGAGNWGAGASGGSGGGGGGNYGAGLPGTGSPGAGTTGEGCAGGTASTFNYWQNVGGGGGGGAYGPCSRGGIGGGNSTSAGVASPGYGASWVDGVCRAGGGFGSGSLQSGSGSCGSGGSSSNANGWLPGAGGQGGTGRGANGLVYLRFQAVQQLVLVTQPVGGVAAEALPTQPVLRLLDGDGNIVTSDSSTVVTATVNNGGVMTNTTKTAVNGVVTFTNLTLGNIIATAYTITFTTSGMPRTNFSVVASPTTVSHAAASQIVYTTQPSASTVAGVAFAAQPALQVRDRFGNLVSTGVDASRTVTLTRSGGTGTLLGTTAVAATGGLVTLSGLSMEVSGTGKSILASTTVTAGVKTATSSAFAITPGPAATATTTVTAATSPIIANGSSTSAITVQLKDAFGNNITSGAATVTLATTRGTLGTVANNGNGTYSTTLTSSAVAGTAVVSATLTGVAAVVLSPGGVVTSTASVVMSAGTATGIRVLNGTGLTATVASVVNTSGTLKVQVVDANGNGRAGDGVTLAVTAGLGSLAGAPVTLTMGADGSAVVPAWTLGTVTGANTLKATLVGNSAVTTNINATGTAGAVTAATVTYTGGTTALSTQTLRSATPVSVRVTMKDAYGNVSTGWTGSVTLASTMFASATTVAATVASGGLVDGVSIIPWVAGTNQSITVTAAGVGGSASIVTPVNGATGVTVAAGAFAGFSVTQSGGSAALASPVDVATPFSVRVSAADAQGNTVAAWTGSVSLTSTAFAGTVTASITANGYKDSVSITPTLAGVGQRIAATGGAVSNAQASGAFTVNAGPAASMRISTQPIAARSGQPLVTQPVVQLLDGYGNAVTSGSGATATVTVTASGGILGGTTSVAAVSGVVTFTDLTLAGLVGTPYTLTFAVSSPSLSVTSSQVQVSGHGVATQLSVATAANTPSASGAVFTTVPRVQVLDSAGNLVTSTGTIDGLAFGPYDLRGAITFGSGGSVVGADDPVGLPTGMKVTTVRGVAVFAGMGLNGVDGTSYQVTFSTGIALTTPSMNVSVTTGVATALSLASPGVQPAGAVFGTALTTQPKVQLVDSGGNAVSRAGVTIGATLVSGAGSLTSDTATTLASGLATFSGLALSADAGLYQIAFGSPGLTSVTSDSITLAKAAQTIAFTPASTFGFGSAQQRLTATTTASGLAVTFVLDAATTNSACTVSATGVVTVLAVGNCVVTAEQAGNDRYAAATPVTRTIAITPVVPGAPVITSVAAGNTEVTVGFAAPSFTGGASISAYKVVATPASGTTVVKYDCSASVSPLACTISSLVNGTSYTLTVAATNSVGAGSASSSSIPVTPVTNPYAVTSLSARPGVSSVSATWSQPADLGGGVFARYDVSFKLASDSSWTPCAASVCSPYAFASATDGAVTISGLSSGAAYEVKVVTITSANNTEIIGNTAITAESPYVVPSAPLSPSVARGSSATAAVFSWSAPSSDGGPGLSATPYGVTATSATSGASTPVTCTIANATDRFCTATGLTGGATYLFSVRAINAVGSGPAATTTYGVPSSNTALSALSATAGGTAAPLTPSFAGSTYAYAVPVPYLATSATITPTVAEPGATVTVGGIAVTSGLASGSLILAVGVNAVDVVVTAPDEVTTTTTTVTFTRASAPAKLAVSSGFAPVAGASEAQLATQPKVQVETSGSVLSDDSTAVVTVASSGGTLGCTPATAGSGLDCLSKAASGGVASFAGITFAGVVGANYTLTFTSPGLASTTATITPTGAGAAAVLAFTTQPTASTAAGSAFARQPAVTIEDAMGNTVTTGDDASRSIALTLTGGTGTLSGTKTITATAGIASFGTGSDTPLSVDKAGSNKVLTATATLNGSTRTATTSPQFAITPGAVASLVLDPVNDSDVVDATDLAAGGSRLLRATLEDSNGNTVPTATGTVAFGQSNSGAGAGQAVGLPTVGAAATSVVVSSGVATLPVTGRLAGLVTAQATFSPTGGSPAQSSAASVTVVAGSVTQVALTASTVTVGAGDPVSLTATLQDAAGNTVTAASGASSQVSFVQAYGNGSIANVGATCASGASCRVNPATGIATLATSGDVVGSLAISAQVTVSGQVIASDDVLLTVVPGTPASITLSASGLASGSPSTLTAGDTATLTATITDAKGNTVTSDTSTVTFAKASGAGTVTGLGDATAAAGVATTSVTGALAGAVALQASIASPSLTSSSVSFTVVAGPASTLSITSQPGGATVVGSALANQPVVQLSDVRGNPISTSGLTVTATLASGTGLNAGSVTGGAATTNVSGVATFSGLTVVGDGGDYQLEFGAAGLSSVTSSTFALSKRNQTITFANPLPSGTTYGAPPFPVAPTASSGLLPVVASLTTAVCQVSEANGRTVSVTGAGSCQLQATQAGNGEYSAATPQAVTFAVAKAAQAAVRFDSATTMQVGGSITLLASGGSGTGTLSLGTPSGLCTLTGSALAATGVGTCTVTAVRAGDDNYLISSTATQAIAIAQAGQIVSFTSTPVSSPVAGGTYTPSASSTSTVTGLSTGLVVSFTIAPASSSVCSISGAGVVVFNATGTCEVRANQAGNADIDAAAQVTQVIEVGSLNQSITFPQPASATYGGASVLMAATASSGLAVSYARGAATTVRGGTYACLVSVLGAVTINDTGTCEVVASQAGDSQYAVASDVARAFTIAPALPGAPHITSVSAGDQSVVTGITAPGFTGGAEITGYQVTATPTAGGTTVTTTACDPAASPLACSITGLVNGTAYTITVAAINAAGTGPQVTAGQSMTPGAAAFAVTGVTATSGNGTATIRWTPLTLAQLNGGTFTRYEVSYRSATGGAYAGCPYDAVTYAPTAPCVAAGSGAGELDLQATNAITIEGLVNGVTYEVKIVAVTTVNDDEVAGNSEVVAAFPMTVPTVPRNLTVLNTAATTAQFSWAPPSSDGGSALDATTPYTVTVTSTDAGAATPIACVITGARCEASGMTNTAVYVFAVYASNAVGDSPTATTSYSVPSADATLSNLALGSGAVLSPTFAPLVTAYTATVPYSVDSISVIPTATDPAASLTVAGVPTASGTASAAQPLSVGENAITVVVIAPDPAHKTTYTVTITRSPAPPPPPPSPAPDLGGGAGGGSGSSATSGSGGDLGFIVPGATGSFSAGGNLNVLVDGQPVAGVVVVPNRVATGMDVLGGNFTIKVITTTPDRVPIGLEQRSLVAEASGWIDVSATGYEPDTDLHAWLARRDPARRNLSNELHAALDVPVTAVYLGRAFVPSNGDVTAAYPMPAGVSIGDYVLQLNGFTDGRQVRSVNLGLRVVAKSTRATILRRGCVFAPGSAVLSRSCERSLRAVSQQIPRTAKARRIVITGVSFDEPTRLANRTLARKRARTVAYYLLALGVRGTYVNARVITTGKLNGSLGSQAVIVRKGKPRTTVTFSFTR